MIASDMLYSPLVPATLDGTDISASCQLQPQLVCLTQEPVQTPQFPSVLLRLPLFTGPLARSVHMPNLDMQPVSLQAGRNPTAEDVAKT